jgi:hypothetical protein
MQASSDPNDNSSGGPARGHYRDMVGNELRKALNGLPRRVVMDDGVVRSKERVQAILWGVHSLSNPGGWLDGKRGEPYSTRQIAKQIGVDAHSLESCLRLASTLGWMTEDVAHGYKTAGSRRWLPIQPLGASVLAEWDEALKAKVTERRLNRKGAPSLGGPPKAGVQTDGAPKQIDGAASEYEPRATPPVPPVTSVYKHASDTTTRDVSLDVLVTQGVNGSTSGATATPDEILSRTKDAVRNGGPSTKNETTNETDVRTLGELVAFINWAPEDKALWKAARKKLPTELRKVFDDGHVDFPDRRGGYIAMDLHYPKPYRLATERLGEVAAWVNSWAPPWVEGWHLRWRPTPERCVSEAYHATW